MADSIYIATVLLEKNRWTADKLPSFLVSDWGGRLAEAGFDGVELWENHLVLADEAEQLALVDLACPVRIYNSYCTFDAAGAATRSRAADWIARLGVVGVKYNVGHDPSERQAEMAVLRQWEYTIPESCTLLCECHPGTMIETPEAARAFFDEADLRNWGVIVHLAGGSEDDLRRWCDLFGPRVRHCHAVLNKTPDVRARLEILRQADYAGTFSIEFTRGVAEPGENMEDLYRAAVGDLEYLREAWG